MASKAKAWASARAAGVGKPALGGADLRGRVPSKGLAPDTGDRASKLDKGAKGPNEVEGGKGMSASNEEVKHARMGASKEGQARAPHDAPSGHRGPSADPQRGGQPSAHVTASRASARASALESQFASPEAKSHPGNAGIMSRIADMHREAASAHSAAGNHALAELHSKKAAEHSALATTAGRAEARGPGGGESKKEEPKGGGGGDDRARDEKGRFASK